MFYKKIFILLVFMSSVISLAYAQDKQAVLTEQNPTAYIALIIDDLGYRLKNDKRAINLQGKISFAILPNTPHARNLAKLAHEHNKDVMLHLPMQSEQAGGQEAGVLTMEMQQQEFVHLLKQSLSTIPFISGLNNHMGSLLTQSELHMQWLMEYLSSIDYANELYNDELFFIDSRTSHKTVAENMANKYKIPNTRRNVFLDHVHTREAIEEQYQRLIKLAKKNGSALAIGHPFQLTLGFLEEKLPQLEANGIKLISVKELINMQRNCSTHPCIVKNKLEKEVFKP